MRKDSWPKEIETETIPEVFYFPSRIDAKRVLDKVPSVTL
jgi:hypothetical protein